MVWSSDASYYYSSYVKKKAWQGVSARYCFSLKVIRKVCGGQNMRSILHLPHLWITAESTRNNPIGYHLVLGPKSKSTTFELTLEALESLSINLSEKISLVMASTVATMAMLNAKCLSINNSANRVNPSKPSIKPISLLSLQNLPKGLSLTTTTPNKFNLSSSLTGTAIAGAVFSTLSACDPAFAAQQIADIAEGDNRGLALLLPIVPAILWVLYNILQPALNQINKMRSKGIMVGVGLGGLAASGFVSTPPSASAATQVAMIAEASSSDNRGLLLLFVIAPAIAWVLFNILQPALNQINKMRS